MRCVIISLTYYL